MKKLSLLATMLCCAAALMFTSCNDKADGNEMSDDEAQRVFNEMQGTYTGVLSAKIDTRETMKVEVQCKVDDRIRILSFPDTLIAQNTSNRALREALTAADGTREVQIPFRIGGWYDSGKTTSYLYLFPESIILESLNISDTNTKVTFAFYTGIDSPGLFYRGDSKSLHLEMTIGGIYYDDKLQTDINRHLVFKFDGTRTGN